MRCGVGDLDSEIIRKADDADTDQVGQIGKISHPLIKGVFGRFGPALQSSDSINGRIAVDLTCGALTRGKLIPDSIQRTAAGQCDADGQPDQDGLRRDEGDDDPIHNGRIAQAGTSSRRPMSVVGRYSVVVPLDSAGLWYRCARPAEEKPVATAPDPS